MFFLDLIGSIVDIYFFLYNFVFQVYYELDFMAYTNFYVMGPIILGHMASHFSIKGVKMRSWLVHKLSFFYVLKYKSIHLMD